MNMSGAAVGGIYLYHSGYNGNLVLQGGTYDISGPYGIQIWNGIDVKDGVVLNVRGTDSYGIVANYSSMYVRDAEITVEAPLKGLWVDGYSQIGGTATVTGGQEGLYSGSSVSLNSTATLEAFSGDGYPAVYSKYDYFDISSKLYIKTPEGGYFANVTLPGKSYTSYVVVESDGTTVADHVLITRKEHTHTLVKTNEIPATCTEAGTAACWR